MAMIPQFPSMVPAARAPFLGPATGGSDADAPGFRAALDERDRRAQPVDQPAEMSAEIPADRSGDPATGTVDEPSHDADTDAPDPTDDRSRLPDPAPEAALVTGQAAASTMVQPDVAATAVAFVPGGEQTLPLPGAALVSVAAACHQPRSAEAALLLRAAEQPVPAAPAQPAVAPPTAASATAAPPTAAPPTGAASESAAAEPTAALPGASDPDPAARRAAASAAAQSPPALGADQALHDPAGDPDRPLSPPGPPSGPAAAQPMTVIITRAQPDTRPTATAAEATVRLRATAQPMPATDTAPTTPPGDAATAPTTAPPLPIAGPAPAADAPAAAQPAQTAAVPMPPAPAHPHAPQHIPQPTPHHAPLPPATTPAILLAVTQSPAGTVDLVLTPEDLGRLRFEVTQSGDQMRIHLTVERPETLDLLRRNAEQLLAEFRQAGFSGATLSFAQGGQGGQQQAAATPPPPLLQPDPPTAVLHPRPPSQPGGGGLDLRL